jgi:hypothetical protein
MGGYWPVTRKPYLLKFFDSAIRKAVSSYSNYVRVVWWKFDITIEWEKEQHPDGTTEGSL